MTFKLLTIYFPLPYKSQNAVISKPQSFIYFVHSLITQVESYSLQTLNKHTQ